MQARLQGLGQRDFHDFLSDALDLDIHLQRGDTAGGTRHLEIHVAQMIFVAQDIGQYRKAVAFLHEVDAVRRHAHPSRP